MDSIKVFLENGIETIVNGLFYIYNSKYYFMYTQGELLDNDYVQLYVAQVCKEIQNTPTGPLDTGYMLAIEISNSDEWSKVQQSITKIVEDKKNNTVSSEIQYLPINMVTNLKIVTKNKFKLMKHLIEEDFKVILPATQVIQTQPNVVNAPQAVPIANVQVAPQTPQPQPQVAAPESSDVIIDYRTKFFEEQEKNNELETQLKALQDKLDSIKGILG